MEFSYGFEYLGVKYGWYKKDLYRLPFESKLRYYGLKLIKPIYIGSTMCYNLQRKKITLKRIKLLTEKVNYNVEIVKDNDVPF